MADTHTLQDAKQTAAQVAAQADAAARQSAEAAQQGGRAAADAVRRAGEAAETVRRSAQAMADGQRRIVQDAAQTFEDTSHRIAEAARGTSQDVRRFFVLPNAAEGGLRDMQQGVAGLVEGMVQTNLRATQEMFRLASPVAVIELQQRFVREYVDAMMQGTATLVRAVRRTADETLRPLEEQVEHRRQAQGYRHAAE